MISDDRIEEMLVDTRAMAKTPADEIVYLVDGWAALELQMRKDTPNRLMTDHLEFGATGDEQAAWVSLLENGTVGVHDVSDVPASYQISKGWIELLKKALEGADKDNWYAHYLYGTACLALLRAEEGEKHLLRSIELADSAWARYALAIKYQKSGERTKEHEFIMRAYELCPTDISLAKEVMRSLYESSEFDMIIKTYESADQALKDNTRCKLYYAYALLGVNRLSDAVEVTYKDGKYLEVADLREGENLLTDLWLATERAKLGEGADVGEPPREIDFRMFARKDEWEK
jgi:tetratricopeptide (TPR) repeat protein